MRKGHRIFHRRQAKTATRILTVNVEVIATVDSSGNLVGQETVTQPTLAVPTAAAIVDSLGAVAQPVPGPGVSAVVDSGGALVASIAAVPAIVDGAGALVLSAVAVPVVSSVPSVPSTPPLPTLQANPSLPQVPSVPPFPTDALPVVPTVPSLPPFPTDLRVPSYPWPSGGTAQVLAISTAPVIPSPAPSSGAGSSVLPAPVSVASSSASISTVTTTPSHVSASSFPSLNSASSLVSMSVSGSLSLSTVQSSRPPSSGATASSASQSLTLSSTAAGTTYYGGGGGGGGGPAITAAPPAQTTALVGASATGNSAPLETPQVVGSVVGSLAGAALILAVILLLLRRHKRKQRGTLQLTGDENPESARPMTQDTLRNNRISSAFLQRFSGMSKSTVETSTSGGERSFQRISGRKLPSAFSEGMTSEQFSRGDTMSSSSFYQDDQGTYGGSGLSKEFGKEIGGAASVGAMNIRPGPARTPVIRHPDDETTPFEDPAPFPTASSHLSPPQSPNPDIRRGTLGRSHASADGSRSSKFTENV